MTGFHIILQERVGGKKIISKELLKIWECDKVVFGEMVTTGPSSGIMSLPRGVRTYSIGNLLILFSGAPTCVWRHLTTPFPHRLKTLLILIRQRRTRVNSPPLAAFHCLYSYPAALRRGRSLDAYDSDYLKALIIHIPKGLQDGIFSSKK